MAIALIDGVSLLALLVSLGLLAFGARRFPGRDLLVLLIFLIAVFAFRDLSNILEWSDSTPDLDVLEDFVELLGPLLWIFFLYGLIQQRQRIALRKQVRHRERAEQEQRRLEDQVRHAQKLESLGLLAGGVAHDFNNILTAVLGHAELLAEILAPDAPGAQDVQTIRKAALRAAGLCDQMLAYAGKGRQRQQAIDLSGLVREMAEMIDVSISHKIHRNIELAEDMPLVNGDPDQLRQVVVNLITNAAESIGNMAGTITIQTGAACPDLQSASHTWFGDALSGVDCAYVEVSDTGSGIAPAMLERIFDPFFTTKFTGRGLGLAATLGIVRGHRGALQVESEPGQGSTFRILLPITADETRSQPQRPPVSTLAGGLVLMADDEPMIRDVGRQMLEQLGQQVLLAEDGPRALALLADQPEQPDCLVLDFTMPGKDGIETLTEARAAGFQGAAILTSGFTEQRLSPDVLADLGAVFLQKPFRYDDLTQALGAALALKKRG